MKYMLDTNICIYAIKHKPPEVIKNFLKHDPDDMCISSITYGELMHGVEKSQAVERNRVAITLFLSSGFFGDTAISTVLASFFVTTGSATNWSEIPLTETESAGITIVAPIFTLSNAVPSSPLKFSFNVELVYSILALEKSTGLFSDHQKVPMLRSIAEHHLPYMHRLELQ